MDRGLDTFSGCTAQIIDLSGAAGSLTARAGVYNWQTGERLYTAEQPGEWSVIAQLEMPS
jgi:hypothetical protein